MTQLSRFPLLLVFFFLVSTCIAFAQSITSTEKKTIVANQEDSVNNNLFHNQKVYTLNRGGLCTVCNHQEHSIFNANVGDTLGPFLENNTAYFFKIIDVHNSEVVSIKNIWFDKRNSYKTEQALVKELLTKIDSGANFDLICELYCSGHHIPHKCEAENVYLEDLNDTVRTALLSHSLGVVFYVESDNGFHIISKLSDPKTERRVVSFIKIKKN